MNLMNHPAMRMALRRTEDSGHKFAYHGVAVVKGGSIVATGTNINWNHAERNALGKLWPNKRRGTTVWSVRVTPGGKLASAKPCPVCETYLRDNGVKWVYYTTDEGTVERMRL